MKKITLKSVDRLEYVAKVNGVIEAYKEVITLVHRHKDIFKNSNFKILDKTSYDLVVSGVKGVKSKIVTIQRELEGFDKGAKNLKKKLAKYFKGLDSLIVYIDGFKVHKVFENHYDFASRSYMGGLNSSYVIGKMEGDIVDIDFSSCYPTALNLIENLTYEPSGGIKEFKEELLKYDGTRLPVAMADISYEFPRGCLYPALPIKNRDAGLFYVSKGRTTCSLAEIHFAIEEQKCDIVEWHDAVVMTTAKDQFTFREFLSVFVKARADAKNDKNNMLQLILKDYVNGMYGKVAQGINQRSQYVVSKGYSLPLPPSQVTNPYIASTVTGLVRAALSTIVHVISKLDGYTVISATTDGVLYSAPLSGKCKSITDLLFKKSELDKSYFGSISEALLSGNDDYINSFEHVDNLLYKELLKYPSIRILQASRKIWGFDKFIEIKHVATEIVNLKTRGQVGYYKYGGIKYPTVLAKAGNKIDGSKLDQATRLLELFYSKDIEYNDVTTLASLRDILNDKNPLDDLVSVTTKVKFNTDYDYKRKPVGVSSEGDSSLLQTIPFETIEEANLYRGCSKHLRSKNVKAFHYRVEYAVYLAKNNIKKSGSSKEFVIRHFLRGFMQEVKPFPGLCGLRQQDVVDKLEHVGVTLHKVKEASSRDNFVFNAIGNTATNRKMLKFLLDIFNMGDMYDEIFKMMIFKGVSNAKDITEVDLNKILKLGLPIGGMF